ncbi:hypothetical protein PROPHIGD05-1_32 [Mycobacterium phage prophiGD05-1]|nr:hypothetical protein PROPHIGD05-1_32 [Mycobacterium phage prophiGD05-1]QSM05018.1 hypothetical protein PROPHIGD12-2_31 [Mycobacterium phage prophiGD12-2]
MKLLGLVQCERDLGDSFRQVVHCLRKIPRGLVLGAVSCQCRVIGRARGVTFPSCKAHSGTPSSRLSETKIRNEASS